MDYVDCFTWNYHELPNLSRELAEHQLLRNQEVCSLVYTCDE
jgi:hypothetical protein